MHIECGYAKKTVLLNEETLGNARHIRINML